MPFNITWQRNGALVRLHGHCTGQDIESAVRSMHDHEGFDELRYVIHDTLDCLSLTFEAHEPEMLAASDLGAWHTNEEVCIAVAAVHPDVIRYLSAYVAAQTSRYPTALFDNLADAREWVDQHLKQRG